MATLNSINSSLNDKMDGMNASLNGKMDGVKEDVGQLHQEFGTLSELEKPAPSKYLRATPRPQRTTTADDTRDSHPPCSSAHERQLPMTRKSSLPLKLRGKAIFRGMAG
ncbi:hypothetical protein ACOMHN_033188 [Nucella lapillus]